MKEFDKKLKDSIKRLRSEEANAIRDAASHNVSSYESQVTYLQRELQTSATKITSLEAESVELKGRLELIGTP